MKWLWFACLASACSQPSDRRARGLARVSAPVAAAAPALVQPSGVRMMSQIGHAGAVTALALSLDGKRLATGDLDQSVLVWDLETGHIVRRFDGGDSDGELAGGGIHDLKFSDDGNSLYAIAGKTIVEWSVPEARRLWMTDEREQFGTWYAHPKQIALGANGKRVGYTMDRHVVVLDKAGGRWAMQCDGPVRAVAFSSDGRHVLIGSTSDVYLWDPASGRDERALARAPREYDWLHGVELVGFASGAQVVFAGDRSRLHLWDLEGGDREHMASVSAFGGTAKSTPLAATFDPVARELRIAMREETPDGKELVVSGEILPVDAHARDAAVRHRDLFRGHTPDEPKRDVVALGARVPQVAYVEGNLVRVVDLATGGVRELAAARNELPGAVALAPDGASAYVAMPHALVHLDFATMQRRVVVTGEVGQLAMCGDEALAVSGTIGQDHGVFAIRDLARPRPTRVDERAALVLAFGPRCRDIAFVPEASLNVRGDGPNFQIVRVSPTGTETFGVLTTSTFIGNVRSGAVAVVAHADGWRLVGAAGEHPLAGPLPAAIGASVATGDGAFTLTRIAARSVRLDDAAGRTLAKLGAFERPRSLRLLDDAIEIGMMLGFERWSLAGKALDGRHLGMATLAMSSDGTRALGSADDGLVVFDPAKPERRELGKNSTRVTHASIAGAAPRALISGSDGTLRLVNLDTGEGVTLAMLGDRWLQVTDAGHFNASPDGADLVAIVDGTRAYEIDQLAVVFNRPDLILERFGLATPAIRAALAARVALRQHKATRMPTGDLAHPDVAIANHRRTGDTLELDVTARAGKHPLAKLRLDVNGVPVVTEPIAGEATRTLRVALAVGDNRIEATAIDAMGIESHRAQIVVRREGKVERDLYFVGFGVAKYERSELELAYSAKDANDLAAQLLMLRGRGYRDVKVTTYEDADVTRAALADAQRFLSPAGIDDDVIIFIAGHGLLDRDSGTYYYVPYAGDPADLAGTAVTFDDLEALSLATRSRRQLVLMDTCDSGEWDPSDLAVATTAATKRGQATRSLARVPATSTLTKLPLAYRESLLFRDVFRRTGAIVLSSSRGGELSYEDPKLRNGIFTHVVLRALTTREADANGDGLVDIRELQAYTTATAAKLTGDRQHPTIDRDNRFASFAFPIALPAKPAVPPVARGARGCGCASSGSPDALVLVLAVFALRRRRTQ